MRHIVVNSQDISDWQLEESLAVSIETLHSEGTLAWDTLSTLHIGSESTCVVLVAIVADVTSLTGCSYILTI